MYSQQMHKKQVAAQAAGESLSIPISCIVAGALCMLLLHFGLWGASRHGAKIKGWPIHGPFPPVLEPFSPGLSSSTSCLAVPPRLSCFHLLWHCELCGTRSPSRLAVFTSYELRSTRSKAWVLKLNLDDARPVEIGISEQGRRSNSHLRAMSLASHSFFFVEMPLTSISQQQATSHCHVFFISSNMFDAYGEENQKREKPRNHNFYQWRDGSELQGGGSR